MGFDHDARDVGAHHRSTRRSSPARRTSTSTSSSTRSRPSASEVVSSACRTTPATRRSSANADSPAATAATLADLQALKIGVAAGTTSLTYVTDVIQPDSDPQIFNDNADAKPRPSTPSRSTPSSSTCRPASYMRRRRDRGRRASSASSRRPTRQPARTGACCSRRTTRSPSASNYALAEPAGVGRARRDHDRVDGRRPPRCRPSNSTGDTAGGRRGRRGRRRRGQRLDAVAPPVLRAPATPTRARSSPRRRRSPSSASWCG